MTSFGPVVVAVVGALVLGPMVLELATENLRITASGGDAATIAVAGVALAGLVDRGAPTAVAGLPLVVLGCAAAVVDVREQRLPDALTGPLLVGTTVAVTLLAAVAADGLAAAFARSLAAAALISVIALLTKAVRSAAMGWGDVKLMPSLGAALGWAGWDHVLTAAVLWALLLAVTAIVTSRAREGPQDVVPYGPALVAGALGGLVALA
jgi:leader peptidase (prepilin peptidase)/N-methyltransferase